MPVYKAWDVRREMRKAVAAGTFDEFAKAGELFCCLISEIQSDMYSECLQIGRGYGTMIFSLLFHSMKTFLSLVSGQNLSMYKLQQCIKGNGISFSLSFKQCV